MKLRGVFKQTNKQKNWRLQESGGFYARECSGHWLFLFWFLDAGVHLLFWCTSTKNEGALHCWCFLVLTGFFLTIKVTQDHCWKSVKCMKVQGNRKTCIILPIIYMTLFQNIHGVKYGIDVQNIFVGWMTEPCVFAKSELCNGPSVLFMKWIAFLPGLGVSLPEGMLLGMQGL